ncbi:MMPL family transporter, partial [Streptomyces sparsus]
MASFLQTLGRFAFRRRGLVALIWVALLALVGLGAATAAPAPGMSVSIPGTEAQRTFDLLDERFPGAHADGASARVVLRTTDGSPITEGESQATVAQTVERLGEDPEVLRVNGPFESKTVSPDGTTAYAEVVYEASLGEVEEESQAAIKSAVEYARDNGLQAEAGGSALETVPETGTGEVIGVVVAAVVLIVTFGSLVAAGLPLVTALLGLGIGVGGIVALAPVLDFSGVTSTLAAMIGLAVGIDYALFIVSRYRSERAAGHSGEEAAGRAVGTAGSAVVFAGLTVLIALAGLSVIGVPILTKMGLAAAATVGIAVLVAVSLVPAVIGFAGDKVLGRAARRAEA